MSAVLQPAETKGFGQNNAALNLGWMTAMMEALQGTQEGIAFIANCSRWN